MITCELNGKSYSVPFVSARALRCIDKASEMYARIARIARDKKDDGDKKLTFAEALDPMVEWFCHLFNDQFTPDEVYNFYPSDKLVHDITVAILAVQAQTTDVLKAFPIPAVENNKTNQTSR